MRRVEVAASLACLLAGGVIGAGCLWSCPEPIRVETGTYLLHTSETDVVRDATVEVGDEMVVIDYENENGRWTATYAIRCITTDPCPPNDAR